MKLVRYGLKHLPSGKLLSWTALSNEDAEYSVGVSFFLEHSDYEPIWMVEKRDAAEAVRRHSSPWYNASYDSPEHPYKPKELEVVEINLTIAE